MKKSYLNSTLALYIKLKYRLGWNSFKLKKDYNIKVLRYTKKNLYTAKVRVSAENRDIIDKKSKK